MLRRPKRSCLYVQWLSAGYYEYQEMMEQQHTVPREAGRVHLCAVLAAMSGSVPRRRASPNVVLVLAGGRSSAVA